jgi:hypothetical protein
MAFTVACKVVVGLYLAGFVNCPLVDQMGL